MKNAVELIAVIESSRLPLTDRLVEHRSSIVELVDSCFQQSGNKHNQMAAELTELLMEEGIVLGDQENLQEVITEYLHVVADEAAELGDEEKNFLESFLK
jgi:hypothetical protein